MSEELTTIEEEEELISKGESDSPFEKVKEKNPNRVKQGFKLAAIGQKAKEEKMRKRVKDEMIKPTTWITIGAIFASIGFAGIYFFPLFIFEKEEKAQKIESPKKEEKSRNYFG